MAIYRIFPEKDSFIFTETPLGNAGRDEILELGGFPNTSNVGQTSRILLQFSDTDIDNAVKVFTDANCSFELMHTVSTYPMKDEDANLNLISSLKKRYGVNVGYSGHESGLAISYAAAALGASSIERHITLDRAMYGSDQAASLEPSGLRQLVGAIRKIESAMGDGQKKILPVEEPIAKKLREHLI